MQTQKPIDPQIIEAEKKAEKTSVSKGERLFDWLTYGGIGFAGVFIANIPFTHWAKYGGGRSCYQWMTEALKNKGISDHVAEQAFNTTVLGILGNAAIVPIKMLENKKPELVERFNKMLGDKSADASVEADPKQSWGSLIASRIAAYAAVLASFEGALAIWGGDRFKKFEADFAKHIVCNPLGWATHMEVMENGQKILQETKAFRYGKIAALDVFATAAATILLYVGTHMFTKKNRTMARQAFA